MTHPFRNRILSFLLAMVMFLTTAQFPVRSVGLEQPSGQQSTQQSTTVTPSTTEQEPQETVDPVTQEYRRYIGYRVVATYYGLPLSADPTTVQDPFTIMPLEVDKVIGIVMVITDVYYNVEKDLLWYKLEAAPGYTLPQAIVDEPWVFQDQVNEPMGATLDLLPMEEKKDTATGITVSGYLPEGATVAVTVPSVNGQQMPNVFDIKIYEADGITEWQPIDHGQTVKISIPIQDAQEGYANVLHFVDYAPDINGDEIFLPVADASADELVVLQLALDAHEAIYGNRDFVAVEEYSSVAFTNGAVIIETDSFSVYTPEYEKKNDNFTVTFYTLDNEPDPSNERTYYVTKGQTVKFVTDWRQGSDFTITTIVGNATENIENKGGFTAKGTCTVTFDNAAIKIGDVFQIDWKASWVASLGDEKNPRWTRIMIVDEYPTTFNANGGTFGKNGPTTMDETIVSYQPVSQFEIPVRDGYIFKGWAITQDAPENQIYKTTDNFPGIMTKGGTLFAQWEPVKYTVTYVLPDGVEGQDLFITQTKYHDEPLLLHQYIPKHSQSNIEFQGWDTDGDGDVDLDPYEIVAGYWHKENSDLTLVGIWSPAVWHVIYNANGGTDAPKAQYLDTSITDNRIIELSDQIPKKPGYEFLGWSTTQDGAAKYEAGADIELEGNVVLYAQWEKYYYAIEFDGNGSTGGSMGEMVALTYDDLRENYYYTNYYANLLINGFERTNYKFVGWAVSEAEADAGIVHFTNGENIKVSDLVDMLNDRNISLATVIKTVNHNDDNHTYKHQVIKLYAVWANASYTILYSAGDAQGVSISELTQTVVKGSGATIISTAYRSRYTFAGWTDGTTIYQYGDPVPDGNNGAVITLRPVWQFNVVGYMYSMVDGAPVQNGTIWIEGEDPKSMHTIPIAGSGDVLPMRFVPDEGYEIVEVRINTVVGDTETTTVLKDQQLKDLLVDGCYIYEGMTNCTGPVYIAVQTKAKTYTVIWKDEDGSVLETDKEVPYGTIPTYNGETPKKESTDENTYTFGGWSPVISAVSGDEEEIVYTATYTVIKNKYTVQWNVDGTIVDSKDYDFGSIPSYGGTTPTKPATAQYTYTFVGWKSSRNGEIYPGTLPAVAGDVTYTAVFTETVNKYTVTFKNQDGAVLQSVLVEYGTVPTYTGAIPTKPATAQYTYTFAGWTPEVVAVTGDATYTATYTSTVNTYTITWKNWDGTVLETDTNVPYGAMPSYDGAMPTKPQDAENTYEFVGWTTTVSKVIGDVVYTARYIPHLREYTVTWVDGDGNKLYSEMVEYGKLPAYIGATPTKTATAQYSYSFTGWNPQIEVVKGDVTYTAQFASVLRSYTVTWIVDGATTTETYKYGEMPSFKGSTDKAPTAQYTYTFAGWTPEVVAVTGDATYTASYTSTVNTYTVIWKNWDGTVLETDNNVPYGTMPSYDGATPTRPATAQYTYIFREWSPAVNTVSGEIIYTAVFDPVEQEYTVTWVDGNGKTLYSEKVKYGALPAYAGEEPTKTATTQYTYTFNGWNPQIEAVKGDVTYIAQFTATVNKYTITIRYNDQQVMVSGAGTYNYGTQVTISITPKTGCEIDSITIGDSPWGTFNPNGDTAKVEVTGNITIVVTSSIKTFTITWVDGDGNTLKTETLEYGATPSYSGKTPTKADQGNYRYEFNGTWSPAIAPVTQNATYTAQFAEILKTTTLTIQVKGGIGSAFLFKITGEGVDLTVLVMGGSSVKVDGLLIGKTYTVTEISGWSWKYNVTAAQTVTLNDAVTLEFSATLHDPGWLGGEGNGEHKIP